MRKTRKINSRRQVDGIVAHLVHSLDAAHMMLTINRLEAEGVHHFAMVHDSFGVHAADIDVLHRVLREEFVRIYSEPVLQKFLNEQREVHPGVDLPEVPKQAISIFAGSSVRLIFSPDLCPYRVGLRDSTFTLRIAFLGRWRGTRHGGHRRTCRLKKPTTLGYEKNDPEGRRSGSGLLN
jgi:hypothetical protein